MKIKNLGLVLAVVGAVFALSSTGYGTTVALLSWINPDIEDSHSGTDSDSAGSTDFEGWHNPWGTGLDTDGPLHDVNVQADCSTGTSINDPGWRIGSYTTIAWCFNGTSTIGAVLIDTWPQG